MAPIEQPAVAARHDELDPIEHRRLHEDAILLAATWPEFLGRSPRPSGCPFDHRHDPPAGTLAALMRAHAKATA